MHDSSYKVAPQQANCVTFFRSRRGVPSLTRDDPTAFAPPPAFGPFRVLHQIGVGALGPVYRTYEPTRDRLVAVKVFRLDVTPEQAQALADELSHAAEAELFQSSIVEPIASGVEGTVAYRAEEYVAAESLDVAMRHYAPASFDTMMRIIGQLAEAIDVARRAGVGHGALHPRDIFVTPDEARASGFGIVDALERVAIRAPVRRPYSAPERIAGGDWSTPADVFSLGAIAFELLTGRRPSGTGQDIGPLTGAVVPGADRLQAVLARSMDENPDERFATGLAFADALAAAGALGVAEPVAAPPSAAPVQEAVPVATAIPSEAHVFADEGDEEVETQDGIPVVREDYTEPVGIDAAEPESVAEQWHASRVDADEPVAPAPVDEIPRYSELDAHDEVAANAGEDSDLGLRDDRSAAWHGHDYRTSIDDRAPYSEPEWRKAADVVPVPPEEDRPSILTAPSLFDRTADAPQVIERDAGSHSSHDSDDRVPYEPFFAQMGQAERPRAAILPAALMLIVGLLIGWGGAKFSEWRRQGRQEAVESTEASRTPPTAAEPEGRPAGTRGTTADASDRPVPPGTATAPAPSPAQESPSPARESPSLRPPAAAAPPKARSGTLTVQSTPPGAAVTINGKWSGRTPLTRATPFGDYAVRVLLPGYQTRQEQVSLSADSTSRTLSVQLQRELASARSNAPSGGGRPQGQPPDASERRQAPGGASGALVPPASRPPAATPPAETEATTGILEVDSRPVGARVFVDDRSVGTTPVRVPDVAPGSRVVRLELPDHRSWTEVAQVGRGKITRVAGSLEPIR